MVLVFLGSSSEKFEVFVSFFCWQWFLVQVVLFREELGRLYLRKSFGWTLIRDVQVDLIDCWPQSFFSVFKSQTFYFGSLCQLYFSLNIFYLKPTRKPIWRSHFSKKTSTTFGQVIRYFKSPFDPLDLRDMMLRQEVSRVKAQGQK